MKTFLFKKKYYYVLDRNSGEINSIKNNPLESKVLEFPSQKETNRIANLSFGTKENVAYEKDSITTTIDSQAITSLIQGGFYKIKNNKGNIIILDGMRPNLAY